MVKFVETNEPRLIAYNVYIKEDGSRMTVVHVHRDSASLEFHMKVAGPAFPKFAQFIELLAIDVYRTIDSVGDTVEFYFSEQRDLPSAKLLQKGARTLWPT